jgi:hypothetical protein
MDKQMKKDDCWMDLGEGIKKEMRKRTQRKERIDLR